MNLIMKWRTEINIKTNTIQLKTVQLITVKNQVQVRLKLNSFLSNLNKNLTLLFLIKTKSSLINGVIYIKINLKSHQRSVKDLISKALRLKIK